MVWLIDCLFYAIIIVVSFFFFVILLSTLASGQTTQPVNITAKLKAVQPNQTLSLKNGNYLMDETILLPTGCTIEGNNSTLKAIPSVGASSCFKVTTPRVTVRGFKVSSSSVFFYTNADKSTIDHCSFGLDMPPGSVLQAAKTDIGGTNFRFVNNYVGITGSVGVFITANSSVIDNCIFAGSVGEYCLRYEVSDSGVKPHGATITNSRFTNHNQWNKNAIGFRMIDNVFMKTCVMDGTMRFGQSTALYPGATNSKCIVDHVTFILPDPSGPPIGIYQGADVEVNWCIFHAPINTKTPPINVDSNSIVEVSYDTQNVWTTEVPRRLVGSSSRGKVIWGPGNKANYVNP